MAARRIRPSGNAIAAVVLVVAALVASQRLVTAYTITSSTTALIYAMAALGLVVLVGRVGLISLCQIALVAVGAWIALRVGFDSGLPFLVIVLIAGAGTAVVGVVVGLPSLWVSGLALALLTLMGASAITIWLTVVNFPNGGGGFTGYSSTGASAPALVRPGWAASDVAYFRLTLLVFVALILVVVWHERSRAGRGWAAIRQSPLAAVSLGVDVTRYKLWAFAAASFLAGVAGAMLAGASGVYVSQFPVQDSLILLAATLMAGTGRLWGALVAGLLMKFVSALLALWALPSGLLLILFVVGVWQVLIQSPQGITGDLARGIRRLRARWAGAG